MNGDHSHCPYGCEHPQPFVHEGKEYCGRCWFVYKIGLVEMIPCTPETCPDDVEN